MWVKISFWCLRSEENDQTRADKGNCSTKLLVTSKFCGRESTCSHVVRRVLSAQLKKWTLWFAQAHLYRTIVERKKVACWWDFNFWCDIWMVGSEIHVNRMKVSLWYRLRFSWHTVGHFVPIMIIVYMPQCAWVLLMAMSIKLLPVYYLMKAASSCHRRAKSRSQSNHLWDVQPNSNIHLDGLCVVWS